MKRALITGIAGQDGSYLAEYLLGKGYKVFGIIRSEFSAAYNLRNVMGKVNLLYGDLTDQLSLLAAVKKSEPDEIYNLAGQPFVPNSWHERQQRGTGTFPGYHRAYRSSHQDLSGLIIGDVRQSSRLEQ